MRWSIFWVEGCRRGTRTEPITQPPSELKNSFSLPFEDAAPCLGIFSFEPQADPGTLAQALAVNALIT